MRTIKGFKIKGISYPLSVNWENVKEKPALSELLGLPEIEFRVAIDNNDYQEGKLPVCTIDFDEESTNSKPIYNILFKNIVGLKGDAGESKILFIKYANTNPSIDETAIVTDNFTSNSKYIGVYVGKIKPEDNNQYTWCKFIGDSTFELWKLLDGNSEKTITEFFSEVIKNWNYKLVDYYNSASSTIGSFCTNLADDLPASEADDSIVYLMPDDNDNPEATRMYILAKDGNTTKFLYIGNMNIDASIFVKYANIDNELSNPSDLDIVGAKAAMKMKVKLNELQTIEEKKIELIENGNYKSGFYVKYDTYGSSIAEAESGNPKNAVFVIPVTGYKKVRFLGIYYYTSKASTYSVGYGFCENEPSIEDGTQIDVCNPFIVKGTSASYKGKKEYIVDIPEGMNYFVCTIRCANNEVMELSDFYCYLQRGRDIESDYKEKYVVNSDDEIAVEEIKARNYIPAYTTCAKFSGDYKINIYRIYKDTPIFFFNKTNENANNNRAVFVTEKDISNWPNSAGQVAINNAIDYQLLQNGDILRVPEGAHYVYISRDNAHTIGLYGSKSKVDTIEKDVSTIKSDITEIDDRFKSTDFESLTQYIEVNNHGVTVPSSNILNIYQSTPDYISKPKAVKKYRLYPVSEGDVVKVSFDFKTNTNGAGLYNIILLSAETDVTNQTFNDVPFDEEDAFKFAFADYDENGNYLNPKQGLNFVLKEKVNVTGTNKKTVSFTIPDGYNTLCFNIYNEGTSDVQKEVIKTHNFESIYTAVNEIKTKIDAQTLPKYYSDNNYLDERCKNVIDRIACDFNFAKENADNGIVGCYKDSYLFVTDLHYPYNYGMSGKVMAEVIKKTPIKKTINGGDICGNNSRSFEIGLDPSEGIRRIIALSEKDMNHVIDAGSEYYQVRGNHDFSLSKLGIGGTIDTNPNKYLPIKEVYSYLMSKNTKNNVVSGVNTGDSCCFYKDYIGNKLRYIFLDSNDNNDAVDKNNTMRQCFTEAQFRWLANIISNTPNDYNIVVISHHYCLLAGFGGSYNSNDYNEQNKVARLIKAVNERSTYGEYDFTNFNPKVLLHHCGHYHSDKILYCGYWEVIQASGHTNSNHEGFEQFYFGVDETENSLVGGSVKEILFDAVVIDNGTDDNVTNNCEINFIRFGPGCDRVIHQNEITLTEGDSPIDLSSKLVRLKDAEDVQYICWDSDNKSYDIGGTTLKYRNIHANIQDNHYLVFGKSETEDIGNIKPNNYSNIDYTPNLANSGYVTVYAFSKELNIMEIFGVKVIEVD